MAGPEVKAWNEPGAKVSHPAPPPELVSLGPLFQLLSLHPNKQARASLGKQRAT